MYDLSDSLVNNSQGILELQFNLSDAGLLGSGDSVMKTTELLNQF